MSNRWMQGVKNKMKKSGTEGSFSSAAARHGMSTHAYAEKEKHASGKTGKRARLALAFESARKRREGR
jgi:hypothetical protein